MKWVELTLAEPVEVYPQCPKVLGSVADPRNDRNAGATGTELWKKIWGEDVLE